VPVDSSTDLAAAISDYLRAHHSDAHRVFHHYQQLGRPLLLRSDLHDVYGELCTDCDRLHDTPLAQSILHSQEAVLVMPWLYLAVRRRIGRWLYLRIQMETMEAEAIEVADFLAFKEELVGTDDDWVVEVDLEPFARGFAKPNEERFIGRGVAFLNRRLSSQLFEEQGQGKERMVQFLRVHAHKGQQLMLSHTIDTVTALRQALRKAVVLVNKEAPETGWSDLEPQLRAMGFEPGWGDRAARVAETMEMLLDILDAPSPDTLERFLARIPMVFRWRSCPPMAGSARPMSLADPTRAAR